MADGSSPSDTSRGATAAQLAVLRRIGSGGRLWAGLRFSRTMIALSRAALRARNPDLDECALKLLGIKQNWSYLENRQLTLVWMQSTSRTAG